MALIGFFISRFVSSYHKRLFFTSSFTFVLYSSGAHTNPGISVMVRCHAEGADPAEKNVLTKTRNGGQKTT